MSGEGEMKRFVSEKELEEIRQRRQEEWEKARQSRPNLPAPDSEEAQSSKTLYEQLQLQKMKKEEEFTESRKFKNQIRGLDNDESEYLNKVSQLQMAADRARLREEQDLVKELRKQANTAPAVDTSTSASSSSAIKPPPTSSMTSLLRQAVKRKPADSSSSSSQNNSGASSEKKSATEGDEAESSALSSHTTSHPILKVVAVRPSLVAAYADSDDNANASSDGSDTSSSSSDDIEINCKGKVDACNDTELAAFQPTITPALMRRLRRELRGGDGD